MTTNQEHECLLNRLVSFRDQCRTVELHYHATNLISQCYDGLGCQNLRNEVQVFLDTYDNL